MLNQSIADILAASKKQGWVMEPDAKRLLAEVQISVPRFSWATRVEDAVGYAEKIGYPVVAKVVSPAILHKSDQNGVAVGIGSERQLKKVYKRFSRLDGFAGMLVEETLTGVELIIGSKIDHQFGPVILLGIGGTGVEIFRDVSVRMAPLKEKDVASMIKGLKAHQLIEGYRGAPAVDLKKLAHTLLAFSDLAMALAESVESIDLNPVMCSSKSCIVADARIMLNPDAK